MEQKNMTQEVAMMRNEDDLFMRVTSLIEKSRKQVVKAINTAMVYTYYSIGQYIVEFEQGGNARAEYGKGVLKRLSERLTDRYGNGWSVETLKKCRKFYSVYRIGSTPQTQSESCDSVHSADRIHKFTLSWNHYQVIMREDNPEARSFYENEAYNQQWSVRQLQRQVGSSLYERLALSRDKDEVMRLATEGQTIEKPSDIIKHQDLGQMLMYVNYFDRYKRLEFEKPTIGILLCPSKNDALVELTLPKDANIYAQQYALCLPDKKLLQQKLTEWVLEYEMLNRKEGEV